MAARGECHTRAEFVGMLLGAPCSDKAAKRGDEQGLPTIMTVEDGRVYQLVRVVDAGERARELAEDAMRAAAAADDAMRAAAAAEPPAIAAAAAAAADPRRRRGRRLDEVEVTYEQLMTILSDDGPPKTITTVDGKTVRLKPNRICALCSAGYGRNPKPAPTLKCQRCESVYYCDKACQKAHWPTHKLVCKKQ